MQMSNIPRSNESEIRCEILDNGNYHVFTDNGLSKTTICVVQVSNKEAIAEQISQMITQSRDIGYKQRKQDHLRFLGLS